jgi:Uma2 family endonuclease
LRNFAIRRGKGYVCTNDAGVIVERDPDTVRGPDVTFYEDAETAEDMERQYAAVPPLLAVEVLSRNDRVNTIMRRVAQLLSRGVAMVWVVDPEARDISVCRPGTAPELVSDGESLGGYGVLTGFECSAADFFVIPGKSRDRITT